MFKFIKNCIEYGHLVSSLPEIEPGSILDILKIKLELMDKQFCKKDQENKLNDKETHMWGTVLLALEDIEKHNKLKRKIETEFEADEIEKELEDVRIEIIKLINKLIQ